MTIQFKLKTGGRGIEWCDETRNVFGGCHHRCRWTMPDGTEAICYAEDVANGLAQASYPHGFEHHYYRSHNLKKLTAGSEPMLLFMDSMSDMFGHWVPEQQLLAVLSKMGEAPHHAYQGLTKAPGRILKFLGSLPSNLWVGVSSAPDFFMGKPMVASQQEAYMRKAISVLKRVKEDSGNLTWMSLEPVSWDMAHLFTEMEHDLDWVVIGAASNGPKYFQPDPDHVARLLDVFDAVGTPVFFKGNLKPLLKENPNLGRFREDFPGYYMGISGAPIPAVWRRQEMCREHGWPLNTHLPANASLGDLHVDLAFESNAGQMSLL